MTVEGNSRRIELRILMSTADIERKGRRTRLLDAMFTGEDFELPAGALS
jgi:hypothetical protein